MSEVSLPTGREAAKHDSVAARRVFVVAAVGMALCATSMFFGKVSQSANRLATNSTSQEDLKSESFRYDRKNRGLIFGGESATKDDNYEFFGMFCLLVIYIGPIASLFHCFL